MEQLDTLLQLGKWLKCSTGKTRNKAITAALWRVQRGGKFHLGLLKKKEFYAPFVMIILCHSIWNSGLLIHLPFYGGYILTGLIAWILALSLVNLGIKQIIDEKAGKPIFKDRNQ